MSIEVDIKDDVGLVTLPTFFSHKCKSVWCLEEEDIFLGVARCNTISIKIDAVVEQWPSNGETPLGFLRRKEWRTNATTSMENGPFFSY